MSKHYEFGDGLDEHLEISLSQVLQTWQHKKATGQILIGITKE